MPLIGGVIPNQSFEINGQAVYVMNLTDANNEPCFLTFNASSFDQFFE
jgi:fructose-specific component phosphotransferase system IIB-like protein